MLDALDEVVDRFSGTAAYSSQVKVDDLVEPLLQDVEAGATTGDAHETTGRLR
jgi:hypothetical protein